MHDGVRSECYFDSYIALFEELLDGRDILITIVYPGVSTVVVFISGSKA